MKLSTMTRCGLLLSIMLVSQAFAGNTYSKNAGETYRKLPDAKKGGTLNLQELANPKVLNPLLVTDMYYSWVIPTIYSRLMEYDADSDEYMYLLAEKLDVSKDYKTLTYTLRKDAVWEDGTPVTSDDAEFTFNAMMDPKVEAASSRPYYQGFKFEKIDAQKFRFLVENPNVNTVGFTNENFLIIQKKQFAGVPDFNKAKGIIEPIGNGPYRVKTFSRDQKLVLERNPNWWGYKLPEFKNQYNFDTINYHIIPDPALAYEKLVKGDIDIYLMNSESYGSKVKGVDKDKFGKDANTDKALWATHAMTKWPAQWSYIGWNNNRDLFASKKTRQALAHLIDYDEVINKVYYGEAIRALSPFGTLTPNAAPDVKQKAFNYDVAKGIAMLKEDGWDDLDHTNTLSKMINGKKVKFEFTLRYNSENPMRAKIAQIVKEGLKKAGITVNVQAIEFNALINLMETHDFDAVVMSWGNGMVNADSRQIWHSKSAENKGSNFISFSDPAVDQLIEKASTELNAAKHFKLNQKIGSLIYDDQPSVFLAEVPGYMAGLQTRKLTAKKWVLKYDFQPNYFIYATP